MNPSDWLVHALLFVSAPYVLLAAYRYAGNLFRRS